MKKYIAPEMEISKFAAEDIITASTPAIEYDEQNASYSFNSSAIYNEF